MALATRKVTKVLATKEDIVFGEGTVQQDRAGTTYTLEKLRLIYPVNDESELADLDPEQFPKALLVKNGFVTVYQHNGDTYEELVQTVKTLVTTEELTVLSAISVDTVIFSGPVSNLTTINNGSLGQCIKIVPTNGNLTIINNTNIVTKSGSDIVVPINTGVQLVYTGTVWAEV